MTGAWLSLLPYMDPEELRELLGEGGAAVAAVLISIYRIDPMKLVR